jgi:hypothetical protein
MEGIMEFKITEAEAFELAAILVLGLTGEIHLDKVIELALNPACVGYVDEMQPTIC